MKKWLMIIAGLILIGAAAGGVIYAKKAKSAQPAVTYNTATVRKGDLSVAVTGSGTVQPVDTEPFRAGDSGKVKEVLVKVGDKVKKGQPLMTFEAPDNSDQIAQQQFTLQNQELDLQNLKNQIKEQGLGGNVDDLKLQLQKQEVNIEASQEKLQALMKNSDPPDPVTAPIDGEITAISVHEGNQVGTDTDLGSITNYSDLEAVIKVDELDIEQLKMGMPATLTLDAIPGKTFPGEVTDISDEGNQQNGVSLFDVTIHMTNSDGVKSGMSVEGSIQIQDKKNVLMVPVEAVTQIGNRSLVFVPGTPGQNSEAAGTAKTGEQVGNSSQSGDKTAANSRGGSGQNGRNRSFTGGGQSGNRSGARTTGIGGSGRVPVQIQTGIHNEDYIEVVSGLKEGDKVILPTIASSSGSQFSVPKGGGLGVLGGGFGGGGRPSGGSFRRGG